MGEVTPENLQKIGFVELEDKDGKYYKREDEEYRFLEGGVVSRFRTTGLNTPDYFDEKLIKEIRAALKQ